MYRTLLLSGWVCVALTAPVKADVFIFNKDGSVTEFIVHDYLDRGGVISKITASQKALFREYIQSAALTYNIEVDLIEAVIFAESGFNANATSPKGAMGLMQLMPATAKQYNVNDILDPKENI